MARIVDSLKNFYKKQGGTPSDVRGIKSISGVIDKIANLSLGGGSQSAYVFDFDITESGGTYTVTPRQGVTYEAITTALSKTQNVYFVSHIGETDTVICLVNKLTVIDGNPSHFVSATGVLTMGNENVPTLVKIIMDNDDFSVLNIIPLAKAQS